MKTPIVDFVNAYVASDASRFHMPGHKGRSFLGCEKLDITEIHGADVLCCADGIIQESENSASALFGTAHTFYSAEGSSLVIKAMLATVAAQYTDSEKPLILAARNIHKSFIYACALLDLDVEWLCPHESKQMCSCVVTAPALDSAILGTKRKIAAVYITSPDYLGQMSDVAALASVCKKHNIPLLVDNAHGAYLAFLEPSLHPIALGADMCCDSAHKTLPVLTGGAYFHLSKTLTDSGSKAVRNKMALFASTSPSYLILQSLDLCNAYIAGGYREKLSKCIENIDILRLKLQQAGFIFITGEPLKLCLCASEYGYTGEEVAAYLRDNKIEPEFADSDHLVLMFTPENRECDYIRLYEALISLPQRSHLPAKMYDFSPKKTAISIRSALFSDHEIIPVEKSEGKICGAPMVSCPPAIPIVISGERITSDAIQLFLQYGIKDVEVVKE